MSTSAIASPTPRLVGSGRSFESPRGLKFSIRSKLMSGFGVVLILAGITSAVGLYNLSRVDTLGTAMYVDHLGDIRNFSEVRSSLADLDSQTLRIVIDPNEKNRAGYAAAAEADAAALDLVMADFHPNDVEKAPLASFTANWKLYQDGFRQVIKTATSGDINSATRQYFDVVAPQLAKVDSDLVQLIQINNHEASVANDTIDSTYANSLTMTIVFLFLTLVVGIAITFLLSR
ncbi:MAG TPA: MCP four helix bundle domain-containing protein, partial [Chloroflexota bacterium]|nr:MCP four helix bundle domain-containing protein [Chloroflexota bacterium]